MKRITCPHCGHSIGVNAAQMLGSVKSEAKAAAARLNGAKGGRPRKQQQTQLQPQTT